MNHEGDIECTAEIGVFGSCDCPCCKSTISLAAHVESQREFKRVGTQKDEARRRRDLFSPMSIYQQMKDWKK